ncbi:MAG: twin-arginine translocase TatA/TatE family subunit [Acidobacteria bacterium]|nr:twin-arginine translocase TatA/TatE family subunit [Acidobacteriota bacterium]
MFSLGWQETMVIFLLALLLFGPKKLPELGKNIAKGLAEFRRASQDLKATFDREMANIQRETESLKEDMNKTSSELTSYDSSYENSYYDSAYNGSNSEGSTAENSTVSASATEGAESSTATAQETDTSMSSADPTAATAVEPEAPPALVEVAQNGAPSADQPVARS